MSQLDIVFIEGLGVEASIGVYEWEKNIKQKLIFDLEMGVSLETAGQSDNVDDTVCYATVSEQVISLTQSKHFDLLEALGEQITAMILGKFPVLFVKLKLSKPGAVPEAKAVGIKLYREKKGSSQ